MWRIKGEYDTLLRMARRPATERILSRDELADFKHNLAMLSIPGVEGVYQTAHGDCRYDGRRIPPAAAIQQLVAAWKVLRKIHKG
jgi:hypothetical protein